MTDLTPDKKPEETLDPEVVPPETTPTEPEREPQAETESAPQEILDAEFVDPEEAAAEQPVAKQPAAESEPATDDSSEAEEKTQPESPEAAAVVPKPANLRWDIFFLLLLTCITLLRLGYLYIVPLDLGPDESYYWDWSRRLDLGYYSNPPMIAWINALSSKLLGITPVAIRLPTVLFGALSLIGVYLCGRRMFNAEIGFWGAAAWLATPGAAALGLFMTTDVLLLSSWCLALYTLWRTIDATRGRFFWAFLTMVLIGAGSLSKQMMLAFPLLMFLYLLFSGEDRRQLKNRWPWLLSIGSLLFLLPTLYWNFNNDWSTFKHTSGQIEIVGSSWPDHLKTFAEFVGGQLALLTPITWLLLMLLIVSLLPTFLRWSRQTRYLFFFSAIGLLAFCGLSFQQGVNPNWPATFYPAGLLLLAAWGRQQIHGGMLNRLHKLFIPGLKLAVLLTLLAYLLPFVLQLSFIPLDKKDPTRSVKGWSELGQQVGETLQEQPRPEQTFIISPLRKYSAAVAFYTPGHPTTYKWPGNPPQISSQYELWPGPLDKLGWDALIVHEADSPLPNDLVNVFENVVPLGEKSIPIGAAGALSFKLWRGENLQSWPE